MTHDRPKQPPRVVGVELIQDISRISSPVDGFLRRHRHRAKSLLEDGTRTETYVVDFVDRAGDRRDAVAVAAYWPDPGGRPEAATVLLRRQLRYPVHAVSGAALFTEVVAGILEHPETIERAATRELWEEAGVLVDVACVRPLGAPFFPCPGIVTERIYPVAAILPGTPDTGLAAASGDGSPLEEGAELVAMSLGDALSATGRLGGEVTPFIADAKTEIALTRLWLELRGAAP